MRGVAAALLLAGAGFCQPPVVYREFNLNELQVPPGFEVSVYAHPGGGPRLMAFGPNGVLYVALRDTGSVVAVPQADTAVTVVRGLNGPHSLTFVNDDLYVAVDDGVVRLRGAITSDLVIRSGAERVLTVPAGGQHSTRTAALHPDGHILVSAGSTCNFCAESDARRAAITRYENDGSGATLFASGLRNSVGLAWHPLTGELWATDNGGDGLGNDVPPDEINIIRQGGDYGWPDCMGDRQPVNWDARANPARCPGTTPPEQPLQAHSAPLGISFYTGDQFPASYQNDAFVAFHGSWNRDEPTGYKVVRIHAVSGRAAGVEDFLWGFLDPATRSWSGRPVHPLPGPDGALYISDDATGNIYRVVYTGPRITPGSVVPHGDGTYDLYGARLANDPAQVAVFANGVSAQLLNVSPAQLTFALPDGITGDVTIMVQNEKASDSTLIHVD